MKTFISLKFNALAILCSSIHLCDMAIAVTKSVSFLLTTHFEDVCH